MFVKQVYDKRVKKQEQDTINLYSKKNRAPKIGSINNDKLNYDRDEQYFSKEDIPTHARTVKDQIKTLIDPDHLGLRKRDWNLSVSVPKNFELEETQERKLMKIKMGFLDHPLPKYKQPLIFQGTEVRNDYTKWNVSNQVIPKENTENLLKKTTSAFENSKLKQAQILQNYINPLAKTTNFIQTTKSKIQNEAQIRQQLKQKYMYDNPKASAEKTNAALLRMAYENNVKDKKDSIEVLAMKTDFKANLSATQRQKIKPVRSHTGIWQRFNLKTTADNQEYWAWSCCMNEDHKGEGCVHKIKDKNRWNLLSFNNL